MFNSFSWKIDAVQSIWSKNIASLIKANLPYVEELFFLWLIFKIYTNEYILAPKAPLENF